MLFFIWFICHSPFSVDAILVYQKITQFNTALGIDGFQFFKCLIRNILYLPRCRTFGSVAEFSVAKGRDEKSWKELATLDHQQTVGTWQLYGHLSDTLWTNQQLGKLPQRCRLSFADFSLIAISIFLRSLADGQSFTRFDCIYANKLVASHHASWGNILQSACVHC